jgi:hypothetical protein
MMVLVHTGVSDEGLGTVPPICPEVELKIQVIIIRETAMEPERVNLGVADCGSLNKQFSKE